MTDCRDRSCAKTMAQESTLLVELGRLNRSTPITLGPSRRQHRGLTVVTIASSRKVSQRASNGGSNLSE